MNDHDMAQDTPVTVNGQRPAL